MRDRLILMATGAAVLGIASPFFVMASLPVPEALVDVYYRWFFALPAAVGEWIQPESFAGMIMIATAVYTVQYLVLFTAARPLVRVVRDFIGPGLFRAQQR